MALWSGRTAGDFGTLRYVRKRKNAEDIGSYELTSDMKLTKQDSPKSMAFAKKSYGMTGSGVSVDAASVLLVDDRERRWRFPKASAEDQGKSIFGVNRICREVCTERDLLFIGGTFYELPAKNAGGMFKVRAVASPRFQLHDYCSWRGMLIVSGIDPKAKAGPHIIRSKDGKAAVWAGVVDDLWNSGKARGVGGPWKDTLVKAGEPSDPYLMTGFDKKQLTLSQKGAPSASIALEVDITGDGVWKTYKTWKVGSRPITENLSTLRGYWLRFRSDVPCTATARLVYE